MTVALRQRAVALWQGNVALYASAVAPYLTDPTLADFINASINYGLYLYTSACVCGHVWT
jgi:hypothetical protein